MPPRRSMVLELAEAHGLATKNAIQLAARGDGAMGGTRAGSREGVAFLGEQRARLDGLLRRGAGAIELVRCVDVVETKAGFTLPHAAERCQHGEGAATRFDGWRLPDRQCAG